MRDRYIIDTRIHCCLYFIAPTGHALKAIDIAVMKRLSEVVNVVPVIAKSDSLTLEERDAFKKSVSAPCHHLNESYNLPSSRLQIRAELAHHNIRAFPFDNEDNDPEETQLNETIRVRPLVFVFSINADDLNVILKLEYDSFRCGRIRA
jgi:septin 3/9/12